MLKTVSSITNAIGALNYVGAWDATTNTPTIVSSVGTKGDYYQVSVAGNTNINGISNWGVGDVIAFNGATWQRIEGGADGNFVELTSTGTTVLNGTTIPASKTLMATDTNATASQLTTALNATTGTAGIYACRAWVNFDGSAGAVTIRASGNVTSITENNTGQYTVNMTAGFTTTDFCAVATGNTGAPSLVISANAQTATTSRTRSWDPAAGAYAANPAMMWAAFR